MSDKDILFYLFLAVWIGVMLYMMVFKTDAFIKINEDWRKGQREASERTSNAVSKIARIFLRRR